MNNEELTQLDTVQSAREKRSRHTSSQYGERASEQSNKEMRQLSKSFNNYEKLFRKFERFEPSNKLKTDILARIDFERRRSARIRLIFGETIATVSFAVMIPSFQYAAREFSQSGFYQYFSLFFSDSGVIFASWKEFTLLLAESLPLAEVTIFLATVLAFLVSVKLVIRNIDINNSKLKLI